MADISGMEFPKDLDGLLRNQTKELFRLDEVSKKIISFVAKNGRSSVYDIDTKGKLSRQSVYRRLNGEGELLSLLDLNYLRLYEVVKSKSGRKKKLYSLSLKGAIAALSEVSFSDVYLFRNYLNKVSEASKRPRITPIISSYIQYELALILQFHLENGLELTRLKPSWYFTGIRRYMKKLSSPFDEYRASYSGLLKGLRAEATKWTYVTDTLTRTIESKKLMLQIRFIVFDWPYYVELFESSSPNFLEELVKRNLPMPRQSSRIFHAATHDEVVYAQEEAQKVLSSFDMEDV